MAKFINKKEQVYDLKLTSYGHHLMSIGKFKPEYYAFYDNNIIYDGEYARMTESQNDISNRIKNETHYIESLVLFEDVENSLNNSFVDSEVVSERYYSVDITPTMVKPRRDSFRFTSMIGDAHLDADLENAPAWKIVSLNGQIMSSSIDDTKNQVNIPQININLNYYLSIDEYNPSEQFVEESLRKTISKTHNFSDNKIIKLVSDDLMLYAEELNTNLLSENFDIEVFEIEFDGVEKTCETCRPTDNLIRKYFPEDLERIHGGLMTEKTQQQINNSFYGAGASLSARVIDTGSVEYYFNIVRDSEISPTLACTAAEMFNKQSYYVDLDFDCDLPKSSDPMYFDIYGPTTEPEVCP